MRKWILSILICLCFTSWAWGIEPGLIRIREVDGDPDTWVYDLIFPNGSVSISANVGTLSLLTSSIVSDTVYGAGWDTVTGVAPSKNAIHDLITTLIGGASGATTLGTFTGSTITDNSSVKAALQALETSLETKAPLAPPTVQSVTCTDSGDGNPGTLTITPTAGLSRVDISLTVNDSDGCTITMAETGAVDGTIVNIVNVSAANTATFTTSAGVLTLKMGSPFVMGAKQSLVLQYKSSEWLEIGRIGAMSGTFGGFTASKGIESDASGNLVVSSLTGIVKHTAGAPGAATAGTDYTSPSSSETFTNKTFDTTGTGNVFKQRRSIAFIHPDYCDETGALLNTTKGNKGKFGQCKWSNSADKAGNYAVYSWLVDADVDTTVNPIIKSFAFRLTGAENGTKHYYIASICDGPAESSSGDCASWVHPTDLKKTLDANGADGDIYYITNTTMTDWGVHLVANQIVLIKVERDGDDADDDSTTDSYSAGFTLYYGTTQ